MSQVMCILLSLLVILIYIPTNDTLYLPLLHILDNIGIVRFKNVNQSGRWDLLLKNDHSAFAVKKICYKRARVAAGKVLNINSHQRNTNLN